MELKAQEYATGEPEKTGFWPMDGVRCYIEPWNKITERDGNRADEENNITNDKGINGQHTHTHAYTFTSVTRLDKYKNE